MLSASGVALCLEEPTQQDERQDLAEWTQLPAHQERPSPPYSAATMLQALQSKQPERSELFSQGALCFLSFRPNQASMPAVLAAASKSGSVALAILAERQWQCVRLANGEPNSTLVDVAWDSHAEQLLTCSTSRLDLLSCETGERRLIYQHHLPLASMNQHKAADHQLYVFDRDGRMLVFDDRAQVPQQHEHLHGKQVLACATHPTDPTLVTAHPSGLEVWDTRQLSRSCHKTQLHLPSSGRLQFISPTVVSFRCNSQRCLVRSLSRSSLSSV